MRRNSNANEMTRYDAYENQGQASRGRGRQPDMYGGFDPSLSGVGGPASQSGESLFAMISDRMAGRWKWAILLGTVLSVGLGVAGYLSAVPMFQSAGAFRITSWNAGVVKDEVALRDYDRFVVGQISLMKTERVLKQALLDPELAKLDIAKKPNAVRVLKAGLDAQRERDGELVFVAFNHEDPVVAHAACNAIINAHFEIHGKSGGINIDHTVEQVRDLEKTNKRTLDQLAREQVEIVKKYETPNLTAKDQENRTEISALESRIDFAKRTLARRESRSSGALAAVEPSRGDLERFNPRLVDLAQRLGSAQINFDAVKNRFVKGTMQYETFKRELASAQEMYDLEFQATLAKWRTDGSLAPTPQDDTDVSPKTPAELREDIALYEQQLASRQKLQGDLIVDLQRMGDIDKDIKRLELTQVGLNKRIEELTIEKGPMTSYISIADNGSMPDGPHEDARKKRAVMGFGVGWMASLGLFFLLGTIDRRAFGAGQLTGSGDGRIPACLGVLPDLGESLKDPESSDVASHCVHQIRNQIEAVRDPQGGYVLAISSPFQGDGKTSIVMALSWSYAAAGFKTLVIDCDMVGRSLTRQLGLTGHEGLKEALMNRQQPGFNGSLTKMPIANLSAVPVGVDARFGPENVRRADLQKLLDSVREEFDIILIDTGPLLGSLESTPVTSIADGVVLSVRRGRSRARLEECVQRLRVVGSECVGIILNCAVRSDCNRYVSDASLAAAEEDRAARTDGSIVKALPGEKNALVQAMRNSERGRESNLE